MEWGPANRPPELGAYVAEVFLRKGGHDLIMGLPDLTDEVRQAMNSIMGWDSKVPRAKTGNLEDRIFYNFRSILRKCPKRPLAAWARPTINLVRALPRQRAEGRGFGNRRALLPQVQEKGPDDPM